MKRILSMVAVLVIITVLAGCGETFRGVVNDSKRIGSGVKEVFVSGK